MYRSLIQLSKVKKYIFSFAISSSEFHSNTIFLSKSPIPRRKLKINQTNTLGTAEIWKGMTINDLGQVTNSSKNSVLSAVEMSAPELLQILKANNYLEINDVELLQLIVKVLGYKPFAIPNPNIISEIDLEDLSPQVRTTFDPKLLRPRPPVITIMGHVDHGKTSLLDSLRKSRIVSQEHGGITQHIGAFSVPIPKTIQNKNICNSLTIDRINFLDTPGHAAFAAMRSRGARCTDLVILVVAADDGIMPQTIESIRFAKEAKVPMLVAINKIDKGIKDFSAIKQSLSAYGVVPEELGGDTQVVPISALKNINLDKLLEAILVQVEIMQLNADPTGLVQGVVIESKTLPGLGKVATVLVQHGTLKIKDVLVAGTAWGRVRALRDDLERSMKNVAPGCFAEVIGWKELPTAGEVVTQVQTESQASTLVQKRIEKSMREKGYQEHLQHKEAMEAFREKRVSFIKEINKAYEENRSRKALLSSSRPSLDVEISDKPRLSLIVKGDTDGTLEAVLNILDSYDNDLCELDIAHFGVGPLTQFDLNLAISSNSEKKKTNENLPPCKSIIYMYNVPIDANMKKTALANGINVKEFNVIYHLAHDVKNELQTIMPLTPYVEDVGEAVVKQLFTINEKGRKTTIVGGVCVKGSISRKTHFRIIRPPSEDSSFVDEMVDELRRGEDIVTNLTCRSLKHHRNDVDVIHKDNEFGIAFKFDNNEEDDWLKTLRPGDVIVAYENKTKIPTVDWEFGF